MPSFFGQNHDIFWEFALKMLKYLGIYLPSLPMWQVNNECFGISHCKIGGGNWGNPMLPLGCSVNF